VGDNRLPSSFRLIPLLSFLEDEGFRLSSMKSSIRRTSFSGLSRRFLLPRRSFSTIRRPRRDFFFPFALSSPCDSFSTMKVLSARLRSQDEDHRFSLSGPQTSACSFFYDARGERKWFIWKNASPFSPPLRSASDQFFLFLSFIVRIKRCDAQLFLDLPQAAVPGGRLRSSSVGLSLFIVSSFSFLRPFMDREGIDPSFFLWSEGACASLFPAVSTKFASSFFSFLVGANEEMDVPSFCRNGGGLSTVFFP